MGYVRSLPLELEVPSRLLSSSAQSESGYGGEPFTPRHPLLGPSPTLRLAPRVPVLTHPTPAGEGPTPDQGVAFSPLCV